jgi:hypothetical protein
MHRRFVIVPLVIVIALAVVLSLGAVLLTQVAPGLVRDRLISAVGQRCGGCEFALGRVRLHLVPAEVIIEDIRYHGNGAQPVEVSFEFDRLEARIALLPLLHGTWEFKEVLAFGPTFQVIEKDPKPPRPPSRESFPQDLPPLSISALAVHNGKFTYIHRAHAQDAVIRVSGIEGTARNFSSRVGLGSSKTTFEILSQLERSGRCEIHASFDLLAARNDDLVEIDLQHQALSELDPYFFENDGVRLEGVLERATTTMHIRRGILSGELAGRYRDLVVHYYPTTDRSRVGAFFTETLQKVLIQRTQGHVNPVSERFSVTREPDQSVINFMLSGLKPAARKILTDRAAPG